MNEKPTILVVDDEESLCEILQFNLTTEGYAVEVAHSAEEALRKGVARYDLILLDVMMEGMSGFRLARLLKEDERTARIPIIFCTARDTEDDTVTGLNLGADDYISRPFSIREVCARVRSVLRRARNEQDQTADKICYETLCIDLNRRQCLIDGTQLTLTKKELEILVLLLRNPGRIFSREEILDRVWPDEVVVLDRTIDVNITRLRRKLGRYGSKIVTRLGYGYGFEV